MQHLIRLLSGNAELRALLKAQPDCTLVDAGGESDVLVIDTDSQSPTESATSPARIVLYDQAPLEPRRRGEMRVSRAAFLANPGEYLALACELADTTTHAAELEQEVGYLTQIHELAAMVDPEAVSERVTRTILNILDLQTGTLLLHDPRLERYVVSFSNDSTYRETGEFLPGVPPHVLQQALAVPAMLAVDREAGLIVMPLQVEHDLIGVIRVTISKDDGIDMERLTNVTRYIRAVVQVLGNIYQLTRSRDLAMRDDLTKAFNRRFFDSYLDEEMERSRRYGTMFSIIFLDLDDLKAVNNFYGHLIGSRTLQEVAKRILGAVRAIDKVVRFGGDEFCIILPQTDEDQAVAVANRVRKALISSRIMIEPQIDLTITASFGIATYPAHAITKEDLIRQADQAMYRVKSTTKNAVAIAAVNDATRPVER